MSVIPEGITHLEVTDNGANFWSITEPDDGTGEVWLGGKWMASEISDRLLQRLISFTPLAIALAGAEYISKEVSVES